MQGSGRDFSGFLTNACIGGCLYGAAMPHTPGVSRSTTPATRGWPTTSGCRIRSSAGGSRPSGASSSPSRRSWSRPWCGRAGRSGRCSSRRRSTRRSPARSPGSTRRCTSPRPEVLRAVVGLRSAPGRGRVGRSLAAPARARRCSPARGGSRWCRSSATTRTSAACSAARPRSGSTRCCSTRECADPLYRRCVRVSIGHVLTRPVDAAAVARRAARRRVHAVRAHARRPAPLPLDAVDVAGAVRVAARLRGPGAVAEWLAAADAAGPHPDAPGGRLAQRRDRGRDRVLRERPRRSADRRAPSTSSTRRVSVTASSSARSCVTSSTVPAKPSSACSSCSIAGRSRWFVGSSSTRQLTPRAESSASDARVRSPGESESAGAGHVVGGEAELREQRPRLVLQQPARRFEAGEERVGALERGARLVELARRSRPARGARRPR